MALPYSFPHVQYLYLLEAESVVCALNPQVTLRPFHTFCVAVNVKKAEGGGSTHSSHFVPLCIGPYWRQLLLVWPTLCENECFKVGDHAWWLVLSTIVPGMACCMWHKMEGGACHMYSLSPASASPGTPHIY